MDEKKSMGKKTSTKEKLLYAALTLFSERGFEGTGVDQIAETIGIKGPSIYRYFKGKDDLLDELVEIGEKYYSESFEERMNKKSIPKTLDELVQISIEQIKFTMHDEILIKFRKLFVIEQFRNKRIAELTTKHHITYMEEMYERIFTEMIKAGAIKNNDPKVLAMEYVEPVTMMLHMVDRQPEKEAEAMERIQKHFEYFVLVNGIS